LHPESTALLNFIANLKVKPYNELESVEAARARSKLVYTSETAAGKIQYDGYRKELLIPQPDFTGIKLRSTCLLLVIARVYQYTLSCPDSFSRCLM